MVLLYALLFGDSGLLSIVKQPVSHCEGKLLSRETIPCVPVLNVPATCSWISPDQKEHMRDLKLCLSSSHG